MAKKNNPATTPPDNSLTRMRHVRPIEYISIGLSRIGGMFSTTLTGTLAMAFLHELYFGPKGVSSEEIADISAVQTTIATIGGLLFGFLAGLLVQKWKTKLGRYRQWYFISMIPLFVLTVMYFYVPKGWTIEQMKLLRYAIALAQSVFNAFNTLMQNVVQVMSPDPKEKKTLATCWQLFYYVGYGLAYGSTYVYGLISSDKEAMYMRLAAVAAAVMLIGNFMCGLFCRERIELPKKEKVKIGKELFGLFKYRNYRCYQYMQWANVLAMLGKMSTLLAAITVGSSKNILLTLPTAIGTVVGNIVTAKISKKYEPTKLLKFCGVYSVVSAAFVFGTCFIEAQLGLYFFQGWNSIFFYIFYFLFGMGIGVQELSNSHFNVEYYDYLEWQTGKRLEAVQGIIPSWITQGLQYLRDLMIPYMIAWVGYKSSIEGDLVKTMQAQPGYMKTCLWLVAFLVFAYALATLIKALLLKFLYDVEGEKKQQMYKDLEEIRANVHAENLDTAAEETANQIS